MPRTFKETDHVWALGLMKWIWCSQWVFSHSLQFRQMHWCVWGVLPDTVLSWAEQTKIALKTKVLGYFFYFTFSVIVDFVSRINFENHIREKTHKQRVKVKALITAVSLCYFQELLCCVIIQRIAYEERNNICFGWSLFTSGFSTYRAGGCAEKLYEEGRRRMSGHSCNMMW